MARLLLLSMLIPGLAGAQILDTADARLREQAYLQAWLAPLGQATRWRNPATGDAGRITAIREHRAAESGELCRDMVERLTVAGTVRQGTATGCRGSDAAWHVVTATPGDDPSTPADLTPYKPPAEISADPPHSGQAIPPGLEIRIRPSARNKVVPSSTPDLRLLVPPPPDAAQN